MKNATILHRLEMRKYKC